MIFIANFKMMLTAPMTITLVSSNLTEYKKLASQAKIIICPPVTALRELHNLCDSSDLEIGAQTCGFATAGAYTGEISPADLAACGAVYCLVGHSERRSLYNETDDQIATKATLLAANHITPIVCIGETLSENQGGKTLTILDQQLSQVLKNLNDTAQPPTTYIAYEPVWAIGSGLTPTAPELCNTFSSLKHLIEKKAPNLPFKLIYGGSVSLKNLPILSSVSPLDGFLIGGASLDFQEFKKIVDYFGRPAAN